MAAPGTHYIGRISFEASIADADQAMDLRPRLDALAFQLAPAAIERALNRIELGDHHLRLDRLELDLGTIDPARLETDAIGALEAALTEALVQALHGAGHPALGPGQLMTPEARRLDLFEHFLAHGRLPAPIRVPAFSPAGTLLALAKDDPTALAAMLRRRAGERGVLERLALQVGETALRALLHLLAPADSATILMLMGDVVLVHRERDLAELVRLAEPALRRLVWIATLEFLLRDAGSQFNRRRFLEHLLRREAEAAGADYGALLALFAAAVASAAARTGFRSSLPVVLSDLLAETLPLAADEAEDAASTEAPRDPFEAARAGDFAPLLALVRRQADDRDALRGLVGRLTPGLFDGLVRRLEPAHADRILAAIDALAAVHEAEPVTDLRPEAFQAMLRVLTLRYLLHDAGTQFNRRRFLAFLVHQEADRAGVEDAVLLGALAEALHSLRRRMGIRASLPLTLAELLDEVQPSLLKAASAAGGDETDQIIVQLRSHGARAGRFAALVGAMTDGALAAVATRLAPDAAVGVLADLEDLAALHASWPLAVLSEGAFEQRLRVLALRRLLADAGRQTDRGAWLERLVRALARDLDQPFESLVTDIADARRRRRGGAMSPAWTQLLAHAQEPSHADPGRASPPPPEGPEAVAILRTAAGRPGVLLRLAEATPPRQREALIFALDPANAAAVSEDLALFAAVYRQSGAPAIPADRLEGLLWSLAAAHLAARGGARFDRRALARALLDGLARYVAVPPADIASALQADADRTGRAAPSPKVRALLAAFPAPQDRVPEPGDRRAVIERVLRTGQPAEAGADLAWAAHAEPVWLAETIRRLSREAPALEAVLLERLLGWVTPEELLAALAPPRAARRLLRTEGIGSGDVAAWRPVFAALLKGETPDPPVSGAAGGGPLDRLASLSRWLGDGGGGSPEPDVRDALDSLDRLTHAELVWLLLDPSPARTAAQLSRMLAALAGSRRDGLVDRLAPGLKTPGGVVAGALADAAEPARITILARAIGAVLAGSDLKAADLTAPVVGPPRPDRRPPALAQAPAETGRLLAWLGGAEVSSAETDGLIRRLISLADMGDIRLGIYLKARLSEARLRARWAVLLPPAAFGRVLAILAPGRAAAALQAVMLVETAARRTATFGAPKADPARLRVLVLDALAAGAGFRLEDLVRRLVAETARDLGQVEALRNQAVALARDGGHLAAVAALRRAAPTPKPPVRRPRPSAPAQAKRPGRDGTAPPEPDQALFVANAGLVLFNPYLPALFERLAVLTQGEDGKPHVGGVEAASRAVHLLQYLVDGRLDASEPELLLNKVLCGLPTAYPVEPSILGAAADLEICDGLLGHVIANWPIIRNTSVAGLRETFLQREGRLTHKEDGWTLQVQRKSVDVLVDQVPWSFAMIYHRWMPSPLRVTW